MTQIATSKPKHRKPNHTKPNGEPRDWVENLLPDGQRPAAKKRTRAVPADPGRSPGLTGKPDTREIDVDLIEPSPYQPRQDFGDEDLSDLASITAGPDGRAVGLIHAIAVRPVGAGYELIDGERRLRRAKRAGCRTIRCEVSVMTDDQADEALMTANEAAKAFNPIERARWIRAHRERTGESQAETARKFGHDQSWISSHESLLKLPEAVQDLVMSGDIPLHSAKQLFGVAAHSEICIAAAKACKAKNGTPATPEDVQVQLNIAAEKHAREIHDHYDRKSGRWAKALKLTPELREELGVITLPGRYGNHCEFATNAKRYDELVREAEAKQQAREEKREAAEKAKKNQAAKDPEKLSPAARKRLQEEAQRKAAEQAKQFAKKLWDLAVDWRRYAIAAKLAGGHVPYEDLLRLACYCAAEMNRSYWDEIDRRQGRLATNQLLGDVLKAAGHKTSADTWSGLRSAPESEVQGLAERFLAKYFWDDQDGPCRIVPAETVVKIAEDLEIDMGLLWDDEQCGPLSERYWAMHNKEQLEDLGRELNVSLAGQKTKADMVGAFLDYKPAPEDDANTAAAKALPYPKELLKVKRVK